MSFWPTFHYGEELFFLSVVMSLTVELGFSGMCPIFPPCAKVLHVVVFMIFMFFFFFLFFYCFFVFFYCDIRTTGAGWCFGWCLVLLVSWCDDVVVRAQKWRTYWTTCSTKNNFKQKKKKMNRSRRWWGLPRTVSRWNEPHHRLASALLSQKI